MNPHEHSTWFMNIHESNIGLDSWTLMNQILKNVTFFVGRQTGNITRKHNMSLWRKKLYIFLSKNAEEQIIHYKIPSDKVFEIGVRYSLWLIGWIYKNIGK